MAEGNGPAQDTLDELWNRIGCYEFDNGSSYNESVSESSTNCPSPMESLLEAGHTSTEIETSLKVGGNITSLLTVKSEAPNSNLAAQPSNTPKSLDHRFLSATPSHSSVTPPLKKKNYFNNSSKGTPSPQLSLICLTKPEMSLNVKLVSERSLNHQVLSSKAPTHRSEPPAITDQSTALYLGDSKASAPMPRPTFHPVTKSEISFNHHLLYAEPLSNRDGTHPSTVVPTLCRSGRSNPSAQPSSNPGIKSIPSGIVLGGNHSESSASNVSREHHSNGLHMDTPEDVPMRMALGASSTIPCGSIATANREVQSSQCPMDTNVEDKKFLFHVLPIDGNQQESRRVKRAAAEKARSAWFDDRNDSEEENVEDNNDNDYNPHNEEEEKDQPKPHTEPSFRQKLEALKRRVAKSIDSNKDHGMREAVSKSKSAWYTDSEESESDNDSYQVHQFQTSTEWLKTEGERPNIESYFCNRVQDFQSKGKFLDYTPEEISENVVCDYIGTSRAIRLVCKLCNKDWTRLETMIKHSISHLKRSRYFCQKCGRTFHSEELYIVHGDFHRLGMWREIEGPGSRRYTCTMCHKFFPHPDSLITHSKEHANEPRPYECGVCDKKFKTTRCRVRHEFSHKTKERRMKCTLCPATCSDRTLLDEHMQIHKLYNKEINGYCCDQCQATFTSFHKLKLHMKTHSANAVCERCGDVFKSIHHLASHCCRTTEEVLQRRNQKNHQCEVCGKKFRLAMLLRRHMLVHTRERKYSCEHCDMAFQQSCSRDRHQALHFKDGKFREVKKHTIKVKKGKDGRVYNY